MGLRRRGAPELRLGVRLPLAVARAQARLDALVEAGVSNRLLVGIA
ncbi:hypothetical protein [Streptomyces sp. NPDC056255]